MYRVRRALHERTWTWRQKNNYQNNIHWALVLSLAVWKYDFLQMVEPAAYENFCVSKRDSSEKARTWKTEKRETVAWAVCAWTNFLYFLGLASRASMIKLCFFFVIGAFLLKPSKAPIEGERERKKEMLNPSGFISHWFQFCNLISPVCDIRNGKNETENAQLDCFVKRFTGHLTVTPFPPSRSRSLPWASLFYCFSSFHTIA